VAASGCGSKSADSTQANPAAGASTIAANLPATLTDVDLAAEDAGGLIESLSGNLIELTRHRLIDGAKNPSWKTPRTFTWNSEDWVKFPCDVVFSFFDRQSALVGAVTIVLPEVSSAEAPEDKVDAPKAVEVWLASENSAQAYRKVAEASIEATAGDHQMTFPATEAKFVKLRVVSGYSNKELEIAEVRILEAARLGYVALAARAPELKFWKGSPRQAAERGLAWLQLAAVDWSRTNRCAGCHVQAQVLMGQAVALRQGYRVDFGALRELADLVRSTEQPTGTWPPGEGATESAFGAMGLAYAAMASHSPSDPKLLKAAENLVSNQEADGSIGTIEGSDRPPILQGRFMTTGNALVAIDWVAAHSTDERYRQSAARALGWLATNGPETTQDYAFKIISLVQHPTPERLRIVWSAVEELASLQQPDGGWKERSSTNGSNAFATGQALYAFKQAGISIQSEMFRRGAEYLVKTQSKMSTTDYGSWKAVNTQSPDKTTVAPTMWAVIGLAGSYGVEPKGSLQVLRADAAATAHNLEIVLDVSGSMKSPLGVSTRWDTALGVLSEVVTALPEDLKVGLRFYGHRYSSKAAQTCQDTELVVPLAPLNSPKLINAARAVQPKGETPLVRSVLEAVSDLKKVGGGSVILITDGEESCGGDLQAAGRQIKASGVRASLNIVGFTLTGKAVEAQLGSLAAATGGRYFGAQDGAQLSRAVRLAALHRLPYDVIDAKGQIVWSGLTSELGRELAPGTYRVRIDALGQRIEEPVTIAADQMTTLSLVLEGDRFVIRR
jgi:hypothetical protein